MKKTFLILSILAMLSISNQAQGMVTASAAAAVANRRAPASIAIGAVRALKKPLCFNNFLRNLPEDIQKNITDLTSAHINNVLLNHSMPLPCTWMHDCHTRPIMSIIMKDDGTQVISGSADGSIRLWNTRTRTEPTFISTETSGLSAMAANHAFNRVIFADRNGSLIIKDLSTNQAILSLVGHDDLVMTVAVNDSFTRAISADCQGIIKVWDLEAGTERMSFEGHQRGVNQVAINNAGSRAISASIDKTIKVWDLNTGEHLTTLRGHTQPVISIRANDDFSIALSTSMDKTLRLWNLATQTTVCRFKRSGNIASDAQMNCTQTEAISISGTEHAVRFWDVLTGTATGVLHLPNHTPTALATDAHLNRIALATHEGSIGIFTRFNLNSPEEITYATQLATALEQWDKLGFNERKSHIEQLRDMPKSFTPEEETALKSPLATLQQELDIQQLAMLQQESGELPVTKRARLARK